MINNSIKIKEGGTQQRCKETDVLKGIGIILMVCGHSGSPITHFIYLFHMAIFFMASGYFWNNEKAKDLNSCKKFVLRKIKTLWLPFFVCNASFVILNNFFVKIGFYTDNQAFLELANRGNNKLIGMLSVKEMLYWLFKTIFFCGDTQLGGATWFFRTLFFVTIGHMLISFVSNKFSLGKKLYLIAFIGAAIFAQIISMTGIHLPLGLNTCFSAYMAYVFGIVIRKYDLCKYLVKYSILSSAVFFAILLILNHYGNVSIVSGSIINAVFFAAASLTGWGLVYNISYFICRFFAGAENVISYFGKNTTIIVTLHFLAFKIVSFTYIVTSGADRLYLAMFPVIQNISGLWIAYVIVGVCAPIILQGVFRYGNKRFKQICFKS